ncbi:MAG: hypothetical protein Terrestrivirus6_63 [Terrestrivirus sp.]|jgi:colicin import membrane protein|uniref:Uncharacterized protein n=1 Tax=Terrestrivirus sp. TaxID=2487775 RepID=A0A3G4ZNI0_9VIRU|nr:MAG: hypothetical protein Terrestrivirus6_63 [Terrestrivirus sp.]
MSADKVDPLAKYRGYVSYIQGDMGLKGGPLASVFAAHYRNQAKEQKPEASQDELIDLAKKHYHDEKVQGKVQARYEEVKKSYDEKQAVLKTAKAEKKALKKAAEKAAKEAAKEEKKAEKKTGKSNVKTDKTDKTEQESLAPEPVVAVQAKEAKSKKATKEPVQAAQAVQAEQVVVPKEEVKVGPKVKVVSKTEQKTEQKAPAENSNKKPVKSTK